MRIFGVDFSGAADAGRKIWIAETQPHADGLAVTSLLPLMTRVPGALPRDLALAALRDLIAGSGDAAFALDAPPSLPLALMPHGWRAMLETFGEQFPDPAAFRSWAWQVGAGRELRRATDRLSGTPLAPANLRMYRQTYYAIRDVVGPLVRAAVVTVVPFEQPRPGTPLLAEICPAATLKRLGWYKPPYKGRHTHEARAALLARLEEHASLTIGEPDRQRCIADSEGDALDSLIAAVALFPWLQRPEMLLTPVPDAQLEGFVYT